VRDSIAEIRAEGNAGAHRVAEVRVRTVTKSVKKEDLEGEEVGQAYFRPRTSCMSYSPGVRPFAH
jgi:hypothetical protein